MSTLPQADGVRKSLVVRADPAQAFRVWTEQINVWWPKGHSRSGDPGTTVILEQWSGGRLFERTPTGNEHDWGTVVSWNPPHHFAYDWFLGSSIDRPTRVDVYFVAEDAEHTRVDVHHRGAELIGDLWMRNRARYDAAWDGVLPAFASAFQHQG